MRQKRRKGETSRMEILSAIKTYHDKHGYSPSIREICDMVGLKSSSTVHRNLEILKEDGKISWNPTLNRTIKILEGV